MTNKQKHFFLTVCVILHSPLKGTDGQKLMKPLVGYYRNFGLNASSSKVARAMVIEEVTDGTIDWSDSSISRIDLSTFRKDIAVHCKKPGEQGVWYVSGRSIFPED